MKGLEEVLRNWLMRHWIQKHLTVPFERAVNWTVDDKKSFDLFCRSMCGIKFFELLRQTVASMTFKAVAGDSVTACAQARGMQELLAILYRLRSFPPDETEPSLDESVEPLPSQRNFTDSWRGGGGFSAIR